MKKLENLTTPERNCLTCRHCVAVPPAPQQLAGTHACTEGPPQAVLVGQAVVAMFPPVQESSSCGRWVASTELKVVA